MRERLTLNDGWLFTESFEEALTEPGYPEDGMTPVRLPHTVKETPFNYFDASIYQMVSGYRRHLQADPAWEGKCVLLTFHGAAHRATVYVNGRKVATHDCGYTAFTVDIAEVLQYGADNLLAVELDSRETLNVPPFGYVVDYMTYGGLYREVTLEICERARILDVFLQTAGDVKAPVLRSSITLSAEAAEGCILRQYLRAGNDRTELRPDGSVTKQGAVTVLEAPLTGVRLWSPAAPALYTVVTELYRGDELLDRSEILYGFRFIEMTETQMLVNGEPIKIRGLNRHQSYPYVGYAMPASMQRLDARILKRELGVNAVRTSHYPQSHAFLEECDRLGLLVFTEIPGWQFIGDEAWKDRAVKNTEEMILQYRNHPSIFLWGVRINESRDDDDFYRRTNETAHRLDPSRPTGGVRAHKKSSLLEDVYTYNDFVHDGKAKGCEPKAKVTSDRSKPYLISEYNGHMYPCKTFDWEEHRREHAIRHANVLNAVSEQTDICGSFGWCMFDYNTHKDFGSGDRICYHGVMDMFRNPKLAACIYACEGSEEPVLEISSTMDIGEHPGCNRGETWIFTNADSVRMYKNDRLLKEYYPQDSPYRFLKHGPILIDDFVGDIIRETEGWSKEKADMVKYILNQTALKGVGNLPGKVFRTAAKLMLFHGLKPSDAVPLFQKYVGDWGGTATVYRFEAVKDGQVVKTLTKAPATRLRLEAREDHSILKEDDTYDVAAVRIRMKDEYDNTVVYYQEPVFLETEGPIRIIGPSVISLKGGMGGTYVKTTGEAGDAALILRTEAGEKVRIRFDVRVP
ncbi:MAG: glycoside hydrolase family 2 protein [Lachnospiraceae bacterium]|nr:glycoside hydrolase family 2 protein [Lachnospiraceae bacterium]